MKIELWDGGKLLFDKESVDSIYIHHQDNIFWMDFGSLRLKKLNDGNIRGECSFTMEQLFDLIDTGIPLKRERILKNVKIELGKQIKYYKDIYNLTDDEVKEVMKND